MTLAERIAQYSRPSEMYLSGPLALTPITDYRVVHG